GGGPAGSPPGGAAGLVSGPLNLRCGHARARCGARPGGPQDGRRVHVMCRVGGRSAQVTQYLVQQGIDAVNIDGGMLAWDGAGRPMVTDNGTPAFVL
ncbi:rhodanese-like domain-containing protein, partial [Streptomyces sp. NPDC059744]|uniref:rhodanese-like domain-containing protein n=1 Tax=Streptomyces sp. NPDC059744 TaxID=3346929 RepID=UPI0036699E68